MVDWSKCEGTELCATMCPAYVFEIKELIIADKVRRVSYVVDESRCIGCFGCVVVCPSKAITVEPKDLGRVVKIRQITLT